MNWEADSVQAVILTQPGVHQDDALKLWSKIFPGDSPDGFQKATTSSPSLMSTASGERNGYAIALNAQVGRITVNVTPSQSIMQTVSPASPPRISDVVTVTHRVADYVRRLIIGENPNRIAIILDLATTYVQGDDRAVFVEALPQIPVPENAQEPTFQINVRRNFTCYSTLRMNRICNWTTGSVGFVQAFPGMQTPTNMMMTPFLGFKIDCNSAPEDRIPEGFGESVIAEVAAEALNLYYGGYGYLLND